MAGVPTPAACRARMVSESSREVRRPGKGRILGEIPFPHAGDTEVFHRADEGEEIARGVAVGLGEGALI